MTTTLYSNYVQFPNNTYYDGDIQAIKNIDTPHSGRWAWGYNGYTVGLYGGAQYNRGYYYISRQIYGTTTLVDGYGAQYTGTGLYYPGNSVSNSYDSLSYTNSSQGRSVYLQIQLNIGRATDDATNSRVYRGGSIANIYTHSGGTLIYESGGTTASYLTYIDTVPSNTTYTYYHYCGITGGSGGDGCTAAMRLAFWGFV